MNTRRIVVILLALAVVLMCAGTIIAQEKAPDTVVLKGAPMGGVKFNHKAHAAAGLKCDTCHHASKPEKPLKSAHEKCTDCHEKTAAAPMKTKLQAAFHNPAASAGLCIDCHKTNDKAKAANAPTKCTECHKKENI